MAGLSLSEAVDSTVVDGVDGVDWGGRNDGAGPLAVFICVNQRSSAVVFLFASIRGRFSVLCANARNASRGDAGWLFWGD
jgi:hypothetical protein